MSRFVGSRSLVVRDEAKDLSFPVLLMYPTRAPAAIVAMGPYSLEVAPSAPVDGGPLPLVVLSHGGGSSPLVVRTLASHLAQSGYVVAMPEHPGDNRNDRSRSETLENLRDRPRHLRLALDAVASDAEIGPRLGEDGVAVIGHSMGGYTALAVAGGQPFAGYGQKIEVTKDPRVKALVLMAPATGWFGLNDALRDVTMPILLLVAEHDRVTPRWQAQLVLDLVPDRAQVTFEVVENAGHYSFLSPFPPQMRTPGFLPATDPAGFDREAFHRKLPHDVRAFLDRIWSRRG
ncbi:alpha/beta hydrolase family protein [Sorangium cellulosum]|uniref:alpha/beta hydrolase family protein n=1 Tax=Sorangium cellulosum TaxID=56 RepID=UPI000421AF49|nr:alpha/beta fold hydrolase [Sorangium cellulosum]